MSHQRLIPIAAALLVALGGAAQAQHRPPAAASAAGGPFDVKAYGAFRSMITERNYRPVVALKDAVDARTTDAVGAVSGLRGEISMIEGKLIVSYGVDCAAACP